MILILRTLINIRFEMTKRIIGILLTILALAAAAAEVERLRIDGIIPTAGPLSGI